jgi:hypothetical protein
MIFFSWLGLFWTGLVLAKRFPDRSTTAIKPPDALEIVANLPQRPGNLAVDPVTNRVFFTFHPMGLTPEMDICRVCELKDTEELESTSFEPFGDQSLL